MKVKYAVPLLVAEWAPSNQVESAGLLSVISVSGARTKREHQAKISLHRDDAAHPQRLQACVCPPGLWLGILMKVAHLYLRVVIHILLF